MPRQLLTRLCVFNGQHAHRYCQRAAPTIRPGTHPKISRSLAHVLALSSLCLSLSPFSPSLSLSTSYTRTHSRIHTSVLSLVIGKFQRADVVNSPLHARVSVLFVWVCMRKCVYMCAFSIFFLYKYLCCMYLRCACICGVHVRVCVCVVRLFRVCTCAGPLCHGQTNSDGDWSWAQPGRRAT